MTVARRVDYTGEGLSEDQVAATPWQQARLWVDEAIARSEAQDDVPEPTAISIATVDADGTIQLLGRGSVCINSGGEKIFPEEVEEALKTHTAVRDAVVVGIPHPIYGEQTVAVIELAEDAPEPEVGELHTDVLAERY